MFKMLQKSTGLVRATPEMRRYIHNILTFMRLNRAVGGGVSALSSRHLTLLTRQVVHHPIKIAGHLANIACHTESSLHFMA